jgi:hypothetical protein
MGLTTDARMITMGPSHGHLHLFKVTAAVHAAAEEYHVYDNDIILTFRS